MALQLPEPSTRWNPYVVGGALSDASGKGFYGREDVLEFVRAELQVERRAPILLIGQRRTGKSSVLKQLSRALPSDFACVYYDLQGRAHMELVDLLYGLGRAIADTLTIPRPDRERWTEDGFPGFLRVVEKHLVRLERLVLLLDEFDVLDQPVAAGQDLATFRFVPYLAELRSVYPQMGIVLVIGRKADELSGALHGAVLKDTVQQRIGRLNESQLGRLVQEPAAGVLEFTTDAVASVYQHTQGHPFCAQVLCHVIWNQNVRSFESGGVVIDAYHVEAALPQAIEFGTNGLNWIYDGVESPWHRLFLAAMATAIGLSGLGTVSMRQIEEILLSKRIGIDPAEIQGAPRELMSWDAIECHADGYQFSVPMMGRWIHHNRPLEQLERDARAASPRAWRYFELASDSQRNERWDDAIYDYTRALQANPLFLEAQSGLASAHYSRRQPGDLDKAIEAYERVLELDSDWTRSPLLSALLERLEADALDVPLMTRLWQRIVELDSDGLFRERALRYLRDMAQSRFAYGTSQFFGEAAILFGLIGDERQAKKAESLARRCSRLDTGFAFLFTLCLTTSMLPVPLDHDLIDPFRIVLSVISAIALSIGTLVQNDGVLTYRRLGLQGFVVGCALGLLLYYMVDFSVLAAALISFFVCVFINFATTGPLPSLPPQLQTRVQGSSLKRAVAAWAERVENLLRAFRERLNR